MSDAKSKIMQLIVKYAGASRLDEAAGLHDASVETHRRNAVSLTEIYAEIERELDALVTAACGHCARCHEQVIEDVCACPPGAKP